MIGQPQRSFFQSIRQQRPGHVHPPGQGIAPEKPPALSTSCLLLSCNPQKAEMCAPHMQTEAETHFQSLQWMDGAKDWFCVGLTDFYSSECGKHGDALGRLIFIYS